MNIYGNMFNLHILLWKVSGINSGADPGTDTVRKSGKDPGARYRRDFRKGFRYRLCERNL
jgi:hypothetical protein